MQPLHSGWPNPEQRVESGIRFKSVRHALRWYFERQATLQSPNGMHPRGGRAADGSTRKPDMKDTALTPLLIFLVAVAFSVELGLQKLHSSLQDNAATQEEPVFLTSGAHP